MGEYVCATAGAHFGAARGVGQCFIDGAGHGVGIAGGDEPAGLPRNDRLAAAAVIGGDDGHAHGLCLDGGATEGFRAGGCRYGQIGGGEDLIFPHHENEIAQSEAASGVALATHWTHVSFLRRGADKMSKSLGNFVTIRQALADHPADAVRLYLLQTHYRSPLEFAEEGIGEAQTSIARMYETLQRADASDAPATDCPEAETCRTELRQALADDLNTPRAVAALHDAVRAVNRLIDAGKPAEARGVARALRESAGLLGILQRDPAEALAAERAARASAAGLSDAQIEGLLEERRAARKSRDFKRADEIRKQLADAGIDLKDNPDGTTTWAARR